MELRAGTSGFGYKEWRGSFYPEQLAEADYLAHYAQALRTVELNNTFYRMPNAAMVESWCSKVPHDFRFALKAPRRITHLSRLRDVEQPLEFLIDRLQGFGERLGCVLFQLPPTFRRELSRLEACLELLAGRLPSAFEFRHPSWHVPEVFELLRRHSAALCIGEPEDDANTAPWITTASHAYVRLRGERYDPTELEGWAARLAELDAAETYVFFKHEEIAPKLALALAEIWKARGKPPAP